MLGVFALSTLSRAYAEVVPPPGVPDARVREVTYEAREVYRLQGEVGMALDLEFEAGERFLGLASGDRNALEFSSQGAHLFLKPKAAPLITNLTILTDRRVYRVLYVVPAPHASGTEAPGIYALQFVYPKPVIAPKSLASADPAQTEPHTNRPRARAYEFCGAAALKPVRVFDDGVRTTILFGAHQPWPAVFAVEADGSESLVNFTATADGLLVHRTADRFVLRRGRQVGCIRSASSAGAHGRFPEELP